MKSYPICTNKTVLFVNKRYVTIDTRDCSLQTITIESKKKKKACNSEIRCLYFSLSIKDMNLLVRLARYLNFRCHFVSEVAGNFRQSKRQ